MASITIRHLADDVKTRLRVRAVRQRPFDGRGGTGHPARDGRPGSRT